MVNFLEFQNRAHATKRERMKGDLLYWFIRSVSVRLSYLLVSWFPRIRPNQVSVFAVSLVLLVLAADAYHTKVSAQWLFLLQLLFLQIGSVADRVDGEIARYQGHFTQAGIYYDRLFHFIFPFALYLPTGYFLVSISGQRLFLILATLLAVLGALASTLGKLRHHIKFKIKLAGHASLLSDLYDDDSAERVVVAESLVARLVRYLVFLIYDWVWTVYALVLIVSHYWSDLAQAIYLAHALLSLSILLDYTLVVYPRKHLFSRSDF